MKKIYIDENRDEYVGFSDDEINKQNKKTRELKITNTFEAKMSALVNSYPKAERDTWDIQQFEAMTYLKSKDEADAPLLSEVLKGEPEGVTLEELCNRVLAKAVPFKKMAGQYLAEKNKALRELETE